MCWCLVKHVTLLKVPCQANCSFFLFERIFINVYGFQSFLSYDGTNDESKYGSCPSAIYGYGNANATENDDDAAWNENDETRIPALLEIKLPLSTFRDYCLCYVTSSVFNKRIFNFI